MTHQIFTLPPQQPLSAAGRVLPGSKASFFLTNSSTPTPVYTTAELNTTHTQPVEADGGGRFPTIYLDPSITYKVTITDSNDVLLYTIDPVNDDLGVADLYSELASTTAGDDGALLLGYRRDATGSRARTVNDVLQKAIQGHDFLTCDSTTDDTSGWSNAFADADDTRSGAQGSCIELPQGTSKLAATKNLPNRVAVRGKNKRGSIIQADSAFSGSYMFTAENGGVSMFDNGLHDVTLDCNNVSGLGGVLSDAWQEGGGLHDVLVWRFRTYGVRFQSGDGGSASCRIAGCEIFGSTSGATAGIYVDNTVSLVGSFGLIVDATTFSGGGGAQSDLPRGIHMDGGSLTARVCHFESIETAIYLDGPGHHTLIGCKGSSAAVGVTNLVEIASTFTGSLVMIGCFRNGSTNFIKDNRSGGLGTIAYDLPILQINSLALPPVGAVGANWSGGLFDGTAGSPTLTAGFNVTSITKNGTGDYTITETRARTGTNTCAPWAFVNNNDAIIRVDLVGASTYRIRVRVGGVATDSNEVKFGNVRLV
jgi:hypothetical protein